MKKRIMIVVPTISRGGAERVASIWANELSKKDNLYDVSILAFYPENDEYGINTSVKKIYLFNSHEEYNKKSFIQKVLSLGKQFKNNSINIVIPMVTYVGIMCNLAKRIKSRKTIIIETVRNNPEKIPSSKLMKIARNWSIKKANKCIFQNKEQAMFFSKYKKNYLILSNPISDDFIDSNRIYRRTPFRIIALGRLHEQKNYELLINAISKISCRDQIEVNIYGDGAEKNNLEILINKLNLNNIVKILPRTNNVLEKLLDSDIYVLCSKYEGMPNVLMEALATGIPSISTNCPTGPSDLIQNGKNGFLLETFDCNELASKIDYSILNYDEMIKMGMLAKNNMEEFRKDKIINKLSDYIND